MPWNTRDDGMMARMIEAVFFDVDGTLVDDDAAGGPRRRRLRG